MPAEPAAKAIFRRRGHVIDCARETIACRHHDIGLVCEMMLPQTRSASDGDDLVKTLRP